MRYWDKQTEQHLKRYISDQSLSKSDRDRLYTLHLHKPFCKMIEGVIHSFNIYKTSQSLEDLQAEVLAHVYFILEASRKHDDRFYQIKNGRAFSYFSAVIKYYLIQQENSQLKENKTFLPLSGDEAKSDDSNLDYKDFYPKMLVWLMVNGEDLFRSPHNRKIARAIIHTIVHKMHLYYEGESFKNLVRQEIGEIEKFQSRYHRVKYIINKAFRFLKSEYQKGNPISEETRWKP